MSNLDKIITDKLHAVNRLEGVIAEPANIVLVTTQDVVEVFHEVMAYTAKMYDEVTEEVK